MPLERERTLWWTVFLVVLVFIALALFFREEGKHPDREETSHVHYVARTIK